MLKYAGSDMQFRIKVKIMIFFLKSHNLQTSSIDMWLLDDGVMMTDGMIQTKMIKTI